jgi:hypothetical protein
MDKFWLFFFIFVAFSVILIIINSIISTNAEIRCLEEGYASAKFYFNLSKFGYTIYCIDKKEIKRLE